MATLYCPRGTINNFKGTCSDNLCSNAYQVVKLFMHVSTIIFESSLLSAWVMDYTECINVLL